MAKPPENPFREAVSGWLLGGQAFVDRMQGLAKQPKHGDEVPSARHLAHLPFETVVGAVADYYGTTSEAYGRRRSDAPGRDVVSMASPTADQRDAA